MRLIFLDIDGVMVPFSAPGQKARPALPNKRAVNELNTLTNLTGANIVISSDWRIGTPHAKLEKMFKDWGIQAEVLGTTGKGKTRGHEVLASLAILSQEYWINSFVILDDVGEGMEPLQRNLVEVNPMRGLCCFDCTDALSILLNEPYLEEKDLNEVVAEKVKRNFPPDQPKALLKDLPKPNLGLAKVIPPCDPLADIPPNQPCQEASAMSVERYIACGDRSVAIVRHDKDRRSYYMCLSCASRNLGNRGGKLVRTTNKDLLDRHGLTTTHWQA